MIGQRVMLLREIAGMRRVAVNRQRFRVLWQAEEIMYSRGPADWCMQYLLCAPCCVEPDRYKLTGSTIVLTMRDHTSKARYCCPVEKNTRQIDLSNVVGVSAHHSSRCLDCGCAADELIIDLNHELGLADVPRLLIKKGDGARVAQLVQSAIEEAQATEHGAPGPQVIAR